MSRDIIVGAAQLGPIARSETRREVVKRLLALMREAHYLRCDVVAFPEMALTTFFPRWNLEDEVEIDSFYETEMPGPETKVLFEEAAKLGIGFSLGYAELVIEGNKKRRFNTSVLVDKTGRIIGKYRKVHLPGHADVLDRAGQHLEKKFFEVGDYGFPVWRAFGGIFGMCICNDRRWPEVYRVMGLQGVEMVTLGFNTPSVNSQKSEEGPERRIFHHKLSLQAGAYQNSTWVVAVAKAGIEDGHALFGSSVIVNPDGEIVAETRTEGDEVVVHACDLDATRFGKETIFDFKRHRRIEHYQMITSQVGVKPPPEA
jgi:predicted amidohydrolase